MSIAGRRSFNLLWIIQGFLICLMPCIANGQNLSVPSKRGVKQFEKARTLFMENKVDEALYETNEIVEKFPGYLDAWILLADINNKAGDPESEIDAWKQVISLDPDYFKNSRFFLSESYLKIGDFQNALEQLELFLQVDKISNKLKEHAIRLKKQCEFAAEGKLNPLPFSPVRLVGINSEDDEYWPGIQTDGTVLVYTRQERQDSGKLGNEDFYISNWRDSVWSEGEAIPGELNTLWNEGAQSISSDGRWMYFTACDRPEGKGQCDIYVSRKVGEKWSKARNIGAPVNTASWESNPSISADGRTLFFAAKRRGGRGKVDLYQASFFRFDYDGFPMFHKVKNLGDSINTSFDELAPFIHPDGRTLFFTSFGHLGYGGADLYRSKLDLSGNWTEPENLGYPINSHKDEVGLMVDAAGKFAYFSSDRPGSQGRDIYRFKLPEHLKPTPVTFARGTILGYDKPIEATIVVEALVDTTYSFEVKSEARQGEFLVCLPVGEEYLFNVTAPDYLMHSLNLNLTSVFTADKPFLFNIELEPIESGKSVVLENIFFLTDSYELLPKSRNELKTLIRFLKDNPIVQIEIGGHTDDRGTAEYNQQLSEKRAFTVFNYLIRNGVEEKRLSYKGYGFEKPLIKNISDSDRARNRRTEFVVK